MAAPGSRWDTEMMRKGMTFGKSLAVGLLVSATLIGCGSDDDGDAGSSDGGGLSTSELTEMLIESGAPEDEAKCVADKLEGKPSPTPRLQVLSPIEIHHQPAYDGPTWLDQAIVTRWQPNSPAKP